MIYIIFGVHIITTIQVIRSTYVVQNIIQREHQKFKKTLCAGPQLTRSHGSGQYDFLFSHPPTLIALQQDRDISPNIKWGKQRNLYFTSLQKQGLRSQTFYKLFQWRVITYFSGTQLLVFHLSPVKDITLHILCCEI